MEEGIRRFVGIDLAKRTWVGRFIDVGSGKSVMRNGKTDIGGLKRLIALLAADDRVGVECCAFAFHLAKRLMKEVGCDVCVLNPGRLQLIYKSTKKTDKEDAMKIAWVLQHVEREALPLVDLPTEQEEYRRALVSELHSKRNARTRLVNRLHSVFVRVGITTIRKKDLKTAMRRQECVGLLEGSGEHEARRLLAEIDLLELHMDQINVAIESEALEDQKAQRLMTVPGVAASVAIAFLAHIGEGSRFASGRQVSNYVGMTPRVYASGETVRMGSITKRGCASLRGLMVQAAWSAVRTKAENSFNRKYRELEARIGKKKAIVAVARRMLEVMWTMLVRGEDYRETDPASLRAKLARIRKTAQKRAEKTGLAA